MNVKYINSKSMHCICWNMVSGPLPSPLLLLGSLGMNPLQTTGYMVLFPLPPPLPLLGSHSILVSLGMNPLHPISYMLLGPLPPPIPLLGPQKRLFSGGMNPLQPTSHTMLCVPCLVLLCPFWILFKFCVLAKFWFQWGKSITATWSHSIISHVSFSSTSGFSGNFRFSMDESITTNQLHGVISPVSSLSTSGSSNKLVSLGMNPLQPTSHMVSFPLPPSLSLLPPPLPLPGPTSY